MYFLRIKEEKYSMKTIKITIMEKKEVFRKEGYEKWSKKRGIVEVYIACHTREFEGETAHHWQNNIIVNETKRVFKQKNIHYTTGDIFKWNTKREVEVLPGFPLDPRVTENVHPDKLESKIWNQEMGRWMLREKSRQEKSANPAEYHDEHDIFKTQRKDKLNFHDSLWLPDCAGEWYEMQKNTNENEINKENKKKLAEMLPSFRNMLRDSGGYIYLGRIHGSNKLRDNIIEEIKKNQPTWTVKKMTVSELSGEILSDAEECKYQETDCVFYIKILCPPIAAEKESNAVSASLKYKDLVNIK